MLSFLASGVQVNLSTILDTSESLKCASSPKNFQIKMQSKVAMASSRRLSRLLNVSKVRQNTKVVSLENSKQLLAYIQSCQHPPNSYYR